MRYALGVFILSIFWCLLFLSLGIFSGWVTISVPVPWLINPWSFIYRHLRLSIVPFGFLFSLYIYLICMIRRYLRQEETKLSEVTYYERLLNTTITTFFGVGVIWTAVGMETALISALDSVKDGLNESTELNARGLLERLVNGGLLVALSTTVFGGICGYLLRLLKTVLLGREWDRFILNENGEHEQVSTA